MTTLYSSTFSIPVYPTFDDDARSVTWPGGEGFGNLYNGGGNGINGSLSPYFSFTPGVEIGGFTDEGLSIRNLAIGSKWGGALGSGASLTYSFLVQGLSQYQYPGDRTEWQTGTAFTLNQQNAAKLAMQSFASVATITFTQRPDSASQAGDIRWGNSSQPPTAWAYYPTSNAVGGDIWFGSNYPAYQNPTVGGYGYHTFIHELGHALGLAHPHESQTNLPVAGHDQLRYSVMSYKGYESQPVYQGYNLDFYPTTPMIDDIAAMQAMYGANMGYNTGNNTYSWAPGAKIFQTIWDAGGIDLIDASNQTQGALINLQPGTLSSVGAAIWNGQSYMRDTLGIAYGAIIENARGTGFADEIYGNSANNVLEGGGGSDVLEGGAGNDTLDGGAGNDTLDGGDGLDTAILSGKFAEYTSVRLSATDIQLVRGSQTTTVYGVESFKFTDGVKTLAEILGSSPTEDADVLTGTAVADSIQGLGGNDTIYGLAGNDTLIGGTGDDSMEGGAGNDTYDVDSLGDVVYELPNGGIDSVRVAIASGTYALVSNLENATVASLGAVNVTGNTHNNVLTGNEADNVLLGVDGTDTLIGNGGNDTLDGGVGTDRMTGGLGDDTYVINVAGDVIVEAKDQGRDWVVVDFATDGAYILAANVENATVWNGLKVNLTGNAEDNFLQGGAGNNLLSGQEGNDRLQGGLGNDTLDGGAGWDMVMFDGYRSEYDVTRTGTAAAPNVVLTRTTTGQVITTRNTEDFYFAGNDATWSLASLLENAVSNTFGDMLVGTEDTDYLDGQGGDDSIYGAGGNDTLIGGTGKDLLVGGAGDDVYEVDVAGDVIVEQSGEGIDTVWVKLPSGTYTLSANVEAAMVTSTGAVGITGNDLNNYLVGNAAANTLTGGVGNDVLDGGLGNDRLVGGLGDDTYMVNAAGDVIVEAAGQGYDYVLVNFAAAGTYTLAANVEDAEVFNGLNVNLTGNAQSNALYGGSGNNVLNGLAGDDTLTGGGGNDTLDGGAGYDWAVFSGNFEDYAITRPTVNDIRVARIAGGETVIVRNVEEFQFANGVRTIGAALGATQYADVLYAVSILSPQGGYVDGLEGNDTIYGTDGYDTLIGGAGVDSMIGGLGNDIYEVDVAGDKIVELANEGIDTVRVKLASGTYTLGVNVEIAIVTSTGAVGITGNELDNYLAGNAAANTLTGGAGNDTLDGGLGNDRLVGGLGDDTYILSAPGDVVTESANQGTDTVRLYFEVPGAYNLAANVENAIVVNDRNVNLTGNTLNNLLRGGTAADTLSGGAGNDTLEGRGGMDVLTGGTGADTFVFTESLAGLSDWDSITDFNRTQGDKVALSVSAFSMLGAAGGSVALNVDHLFYDHGTGALIYNETGVGGAAAGLTIAVLGTATHPAFTAADILLVA